MKIKEMLDVIIDKGNVKDMYALNDMLNDLICDLKEQNPRLYKEYKKELMGIAYDYKLNEDMVKEIVCVMKPLGEYWNYEITSKIKNEYDLSVNNNDFYIVMNSLVNDYNEVIDKENIETYAKLANAFINDEDAIEDKVWEYYLNIVK